MTAKAHIPDFNYEVRHKFDILDFTCPHTDITNLLGIQPSKAWNRGDPIEGKPGRVYNASRWIHETPAVHTDTAGMNACVHAPSLESLIELVYSVRQRLREIPVAPSLSVVTIIHADTFNAAMRITPKMMRLLAEANVEYIYDPYLG